MRQAGLLGVGTAIAHDSLANGAVFFGREARIKVGVVGCGDRGKGLIHTMAKAASKWFEPVAYCDVLDFRAAEAGRIVPAATAYGDYRALLEDPKVSAVFIAVPLNDHFTVARDAILAGKHVYLEKTMTFTIPEALQLVKLVESRPKQTFQVGYQYRYSPLYFKVKEMIQSGYLGEVTQIDCRWDRNNDWRRETPDPALEQQINWRLYKAYSGGLVAELLSHQMDFIHWAFDTHPDELVGAGGVDIYHDGRETYDNVQLILRYNKRGLIGNFGTTLGNARDGFLFKIKGTKGTISLLMNTGLYYPEEAAAREQGLVDGVTGATKIEQRTDGGIPILPQPTLDGTIYALEDFHRSILRGTMPSSNVYTGAKSAICTVLANKSLYTGETQHWKAEYGA